MKTHSDKPHLGTPHRYIYVGYFYDYIGPGIPDTAFETREQAETWKKMMLDICDPGVGDWLPEYREVCLHEN